ncbi:MAG: hypothetical protein LAO76_07170 [Acidobacteriia bacterium]|nr:hypothetical protein [Terriglobia bacterium]
MQTDFSVELGGDAPALEIPWRSDDPGVRYYDLKMHPELVLQIPEARAYPELTSFLSRINAAGFPLATAKCDVWSSSKVAPEEEIFGDRKLVSYVDLIFIDESDRYSFEKHEAFVKELCRLLGHAPEIAATVELVVRHCYYHQERSVSESAEPEGRSLSPTREPASTSPGKPVEVYEQADIARCIEHVDSTIRAMHFDGPAGATDDDEHLDVVTQNETANVTPLDENDDDRLRDDPRMDGPNVSVTGFCITAYVTGFGDSDYDPVRRWTIGLNLLQHAIVQLISNSQPSL